MLSSIIPMLLLVGDTFCDERTFRRRVARPLPAQTVAATQFLRTLGHDLHEIAGIALTSLRSLCASLPHSLGLRISDRLSARGAGGHSRWHRRASAPETAARPGQGRKKRSADAQRATDRQVGWSVASVGTSGSHRSQREGTEQQQLCRSCSGGILTWSKLRRCASHRPCDFD